jgi:hypothetical protein
MLRVQVRARRGLASIYHYNNTNLITMPITTPKPITPIRIICSIK